MRTIHQPRSQLNPNLIRILKTEKFCKNFYEDAVMIGLKLRRYWVTERRGFIILILAIGKLCSFPIAR